MLSKCSTTTKLTQAKRLGFLPCLKAGHLQAQTVKPLQKSEYRLSSQKKKKKKGKRIGIPYMPCTIKTLMKTLV